MDFLDSRHLTNLDGFVQLFAVPGEYTYRLTTAPDPVHSSAEPVFRLVVRPGSAAKGEGNQWDSAVTWDATLRCYLAKPETLDIEQNDFVVWHCDHMIGLPPYAVRGQGQGQGSLGTFASDALGPNAAFSHLFIAPGQYRYRVNGKGQHSVTVIDHQRIDPIVRDRHWREIASVQLSEGVPTPDQIEIIAGQTVVWLVETDRGVTIEAGG